MNRYEPRDLQSPFSSHSDPIQVLEEPMNPTGEPQGVGQDHPGQIHTSPTSLANSTGFPTTSQLCRK